MFLTYFSLFFTALLAATLLPASSEALLTALLISQQHHAGLLVITATLGNTLGSCINWWLGTVLERYKNRSWFPVSQQQLDKAQEFFQRYGYPSLLLSWVPIIGDPLTVAAGVLRMSFLPFFFIVLLAKGLRYSAILWIYNMAV